MKEAHPEEFARAVEFDGLIRDMTGGGVSEPAFIHRSLRPLGEVDFDAPKDPGQLRLFEANGFGNECEGMCGV